MVIALVGLYFLGLGIGYALGREGRHAPQERRPDPDVIERGGKEALSPPLPPQATDGKPPPPPAGSGEYA